MTEEISNIQAEQEKEVAVIEAVQESKTEDVANFITMLDKLEGFKRYTLVIPLEIAFIGVVFVMAYQGQVTEALAAVTGLLGGMIGYYFGSHQLGESNV